MKTFKRFRPDYVSQGRGLNPKLPNKEQVFNTRPRLLELKQSNKCKKTSFCKGEVCVCSMECFKSVRLMTCVMVCVP